MARTAGRVVRLGAWLCLLVGLAACGAGGATVVTGSPASGLHGTTGPQGGSVVPATGSGAAYPLVVTRSGGIAGFHDVLTVTADRWARLVATDGTARSCRIGEADWPRIQTSVAGIDWRPAPTSAPYPDHLAVLATSPQAGPTELPGDHPLVLLLTRLAAREPTPECMPGPGGVG